MLISIGIALMLLGNNTAPYLENMLHNARGLALAAVLGSVAVIPFCMGIALVILGMVARRSGRL